MTHHAGVLLEVLIPDAAEIETFCHALGHDRVHQVPAEAVGVPARNLELWVHLLDLVVANQLK